MTETIFTKIIKGEVPCYKIYEDDKTLAILDIDPLSDGHTLVISKNQVDKVYELPDSDYQALFQTVQKIAQRINDKLGVRAGIVVEGLDIPHAHVHVVPMYDINVLQLHHGYPVDKSQDALTAMAEKLEF